MSARVRFARWMSAHVRHPGRQATWERRAWWWALGDEERRLRRGR